MIIQRRFLFRGTYLFRWVLILGSNTLWIFYWNVKWNNHLHRYRVENHIRFINIAARSRNSSFLWCSFSPHFYSKHLDPICIGNWFGSRGFSFFGFLTHFHTSLMSSRKRNRYSCVRIIVREITLQACRSGEVFKMNKNRNYVPYFLCFNDFFFTHHVNWLPQDITHVNTNNTPRSFNI